MNDSDFGENEIESFPHNSLIDSKIPLQVIRIWSQSIETLKSNKKVRVIFLWSHVLLFRFSSCELIIISPSAATFVNTFLHNMSSSEQIF